MGKYGLLIDYHYCTGCHACEVACQQENNYSSGHFGVTVTEYIMKNRNGLSIDYVPFFTDLCNLCLHRVKDGRQPACVKHCLARCMTHGPISELLRMVEDKPKSVLYSLK